MPSKTKIEDITGVVSLGLGLFQPDQTQAFDSPAVARTGLALPNGQTLSESMKRVQKESPATPTGLSLPTGESLTESAKKAALVEEKKEETKEEENEKEEKK